MIIRDDVAVILRMHPFRLPGCPPNPKPVNQAAPTGCKLKFDMLGT